VEVSLTAGAVIAAILVGVSVPVDPGIALGAVAIVLIGGGVMAIRPSTLALAAAVAAVALPGLANLGLLPAVAGFLDIPLAWAAWIGALLRARRGPSRAGGLTLAGPIGALAAAVTLSSIFHPVEPQRAVAYFLLLGEPFALVGASADALGRQRSDLFWRVWFALALVQLPIALWQALTIGPADPVQGTLYGKGAGAHLLGGILTLCSLVLLSRPSSLPPWAVATVPFMWGTALLADAKTPLLAGAAGALAWTLWAPSQRSAAWRRRIAVALASAALLASTLYLYPAGQVARAFLEAAREGRWGKLVVASSLWGRMSAEPSAFLFGLGPARTVSRASFMTTDLLLKPASPVRLLGLAPSQIAVDVQAAIDWRLGRQALTSFNSAQSSALGLFGDLGAVGLAVYGWMVWQVVAALRRRSGSSGAVFAGWMMFLVLGIVFDWWEEPPFTLYLALVTGLVLSGQVGACTLRRRSGHGGISPGAVAAPETGKR
jgi:hypothetical protein